MIPPPPHPGPILTNFFLPLGQGFLLKKIYCKKTRASRTAGAKGNNLFASNKQLRYQVSDIKYHIACMRYKV